MTCKTAKIKITNKSYKAQEGVALIQVLLISTIISLLAIRFSYTAREQINTATAFEQRIKAVQQLKSIQSKIIYTLLTQSTLTQANELFPLSESWNFYGKPFSLEKSENISITVTMQDIAGLLPQQFITWPMWRTILQNMDYTEYQAKQVQGEINDSQDRDADSWIVGNIEPITVSGESEYRNLPIQLPQEIDRFFSEMPDKLTDIKQISMQYPIAGFNIMHAPERLITLLFSREDAAEIIKKREEKQLSKTDIIGFLSDSYDAELYSFYPASQIKLTIYVNSDDIQLQETIEFKIQPNKNEPILLFSRY